MRLGQVIGLTACVLTGTTGAGFLYAGWDDFSVAFERKQPLEGVRKPLFTQEEIRPAASAQPAPPVPGERQNTAVIQVAAVGPAALPGSVAGAVSDADTAAPAQQVAAVDSTPIIPDAAPAPGTAPIEVDEDGNVTPTLEAARGGSRRGLVILHIGDSHTSADFLTGELRKRLQAKYGAGAPGYVTAGHPHIGVRSSSLKITASKGWSYKSLQKPDAVPTEFWLSGYNAIASAPGETMTFAADKAQNFEMIEIEVLRQPGGGKIDVKLDGYVATTYDLAASKPDPVVIRLLPARGPTERVREIAITTTGAGPVSIASVAIYNKQSGLTYNSVGYPGAQATFVNKLNNKLFANDLIRINPQIVVLSFGTNEASNEKLDIAHYTESYERILEKIKAVLPEAAVVMIGPPDFAELPAACRKDNASQAACGKQPAAAGSASATNGTASDAPGAADCIWKTPPRLGQIREAQREIAAKHGLVYWNWASIMPTECGAHRWYSASPPLMSKDHVHFTIAGYKKSAEQFLTTLIPVIEKVRLGANAVSNN
jgi:lysophospholipase L1-like esterase